MAASASESQQLLHSAGEQNYATWEASEHAALQHDGAHSLSPPDDDNDCIDACDGCCRGRRLCVASVFVVVLALAATLVPPCCYHELAAHTDLIEAYYNVALSVLCLGLYFAVARKPKPTDPFIKSLDDALAAAIKLDAATDVANNRTPSTLARDAMELRSQYMPLDLPLESIPGVNRIDDQIGALLDDGEKHGADPLGLLARDRSGRTVAPSPPKKSRRDWVSDAKEVWKDATKTLTQAFWLFLFGVVWSFPAFAPGVVRVYQHRTFFASAGACGPATFSLNLLYGGSFSYILTMILVVPYWDNLQKLKFGSKSLGTLVTHIKDVPDLQIWNKLALRHQDVTDYTMRSGSVGWIVNCMAVAAVATIAVALLVLFFPLHVLFTNSTLVIVAYWALLLDGMVLWTLKVMDEVESGFRGAVGVLRAAAIRSYNPLKNPAVVGKEKYLTPDAWTETYAYQNILKHWTGRGIALELRFIGIRFNVGQAYSRLVGLVTAAISTYIGASVNSLWKAYQAQALKP